MAGKAGLCNESKITQDNSGGNTVATTAEAILPYFRTYLLFFGFTKRSLHLYYAKL